MLAIECPPTYPPCKLWDGSISDTGYGARWYKGKLWSAHRASFDENYGPIPEGMLVCHSCDNRACIEPEHLFLGTYRDNVYDMISKDRQVKHEFCQRGHSMHNAYRSVGRRWCKPCHDATMRRYELRRASTCDLSR